MSQCCRRGRHCYSPHHAALSRTKRPCPSARHMPPAIPRRCLRFLRPPAGLIGRLGFCGKLLLHRVQARPHGIRSCPLAADSLFRPLCPRQQPTRVSATAAACSAAWASASWACIALRRSRSASALVGRSFPPTSACWRRRESAHKRRRVRSGVEIVFAQGRCRVGPREDAKSSR